jgi:hypothetical protein
MAIEDKSTVSTLFVDVGCQLSLQGTVIYMYYYSVRDILLVFIPAAQPRPFRSQVLYDRAAGAVRTF